MKKLSSYLSLLFLPILFFSSCTEKDDSTSNPDLSDSLVNKQTHLYYKYEVTLYDSISMNPLAFGSVEYAPSSNPLKFYSNASGVYNGMFTLSFYPKYPMIPNLYGYLIHSNADGFGCHQILGADFSSDSTKLNKIKIFSLPWGINKIHLRNDSNKTNLELLKFNQDYFSLGHLYSFIPQEKISLSNPNLDTTIYIKAFPNKWTGYSLHDTITSAYIRNINIETPSKDTIAIDIFY